MCWWVLCTCLQMYVYVYRRERCQRDHCKIRETRWRSRGWPIRSSSMGSWWSLLYVVSIVRMKEGGTKQLWVNLSREGGWEGRTKWWGHLRAWVWVNTNANEHAAVMHIVCEYLQDNHFPCRYNCGFYPGLYPPMWWTIMKLKGSREKIDSEEKSIKSVGHLICTCSNVFTEWTHMLIVMNK